MVHQAKSWWWGDFTATHEIIQWEQCSNWASLVSCSGMRMQTYEQEKQGTYFTSVRPNKVKISMETQWVSPDLTPPASHTVLPGDKHSSCLDTNTGTQAVEPTPASKAHSSIHASNLIISPAQRQLRNENRWEAPPEPSACVTVVPLTVNNTHKRLLQTK